MGFFDFLSSKHKQEVVSPVPEVNLGKLDEKVVEVKKRAVKKGSKPEADRIDNSDLNDLSKTGTKLANKSDKKPAAKKSSRKVKTKDEEPYIKVLEVTFDKNNPRYGSFEFDFNKAFVLELIKAGYQGKEDSDIVENWFTDVCRHVAMETYEQDVAQTPGLARKMKVRNISNTHKSVE